MTGAVPHNRKDNPAVIDMFGTQVESKHGFVALSLGTVLMIGLSCYLEEWMLKAMVGFKFYWTMAFFELVVFAAITYAVSKGWSGGHKLEPRAAPITLYIASATTMALYTSLGKIAYKYVNYATGREDETTYHANVPRTPPPPPSSPPPS